VFDPSAIADLKAQVTSSEMTPPLSENSMGNLFWIAATRYVAESKPGFNDFFYLFTWVFGPACVHHD
jgi:hypothetical protein